MTLCDILQSQETTGIQPCFDCSGRRLSAPPSGAVKARLSKLHNVVVLVAISSESGSATEFRGDSLEIARSEEHTSELQSRLHLVCRLLLEKKKKTLIRGARGRQ